MSDGDPPRIADEALDETPAPPHLAPHEEPPASSADREQQWAADHTTRTRDISAAVGSGGGPGSWERARPGAAVWLQRSGWADAAWSFLYGANDTGYRGRPADAESIVGANRRMRSGELGPVNGPLINAPVWTWEVPLYFWFGGIASGASFVSLGCDLAGDHRSASITRKVALAAALPSAPLLIADLGRPARFLNMLRIFKPRSPMSLGAWSLVAFSNLAVAAVAAEALGRPRVARAIGAGNAVVGGYLGSYTGVLLAATAVPVWARSRLMLGPIFVATATATGAAATRLTLVRAGLPEGHPTRTAVGSIETAAMLTELALSALNERSLGAASRCLEQGTPGRLFKAATWTARGGLGLQLACGRLGPRAHDVASVCYLGAGLAFRHAWVGAGRSSAQDHDSVARMARGELTENDQLGAAPVRRRLQPSLRSPLTFVGGVVPRGLYADAVRRMSLAAERRLRRLRGGDRCTTGPDDYAP